MSTIFNNRYQNWEPIISLDKIWIKMWYFLILKCESRYIWVLFYTHDRFQNTNKYSENYLSKQMILPEGQGKKLWDILFAEGNPAMSLWWGLLELEEDEVHWISFQWATTENEKKPRNIKSWMQGNLRTCNLPCIYWEWTIIVYIVLRKCEHNQHQLPKVHRLINSLSHWNEFAEN